MNLARSLQNWVAKSYHEQELIRAGNYLMYHRSMVRVFEERVEEGRIELERLRGIK